MHEHFPDAELARYATDPYSVPADRRQAIEEETAHCATCRTTLDFFSVMTVEDLADTEEPADRASDDDPMREYVERIAEEDREADELLAEKKLLDSPAKTAWTNLTRDRRMLSGGIVRRLTAHAHAICENDPLAALTFADAATSVAETLPDHTYPRKAVFELRGTAWKERANALLVLGQFPAAHDALTHAERAYRNLSSPGFGLSSVALIRAGVLGEQGRLDEALQWAERAEIGFAHIGQDERRMRAVFLRGSILHEVGEIATAILLFQQVLDYAEAVNSLRWIGSASYALGNCEVDRQNLGEASIHLHKALVIFREIGPDWERLVTEWALGRIVLHGGNQSEAIRRLRTVAVELENRSMIEKAALVWLDIVEALLAMGEMKEIAGIATRVFHVFKDADVITGALTAMAYLQEAATSGKLTPAGVHAVRTYLRRSMRQPELMFEPPPERFP